MSTGESGYFQIRRRSKLLSSLLPNNKARTQQQQQSIFAITIERFMVHALNIFYCRVALGTRVNPNTIGCVWTGDLDMNTLRVDGEIFESRMKKLRIQKHSDTCGWRLKVIFLCDPFSTSTCVVVTPVSYSKCIYILKMFRVLAPGNLTFVS